MVYLNHVAPLLPLWLSYAAEHNVFSFVNRALYRWTLTFGEYSVTYFSSVCFSVKSSEV